MGINNYKWVELSWIKTLNSVIRVNSPERATKVLVTMGTKVLQVLIPQRCTHTHKQHWPESGPLLLFMPIHTSEVFIWHLSLLSVYKFHWIYKVGSVHAHEAALEPKVGELLERKLVSFYIFTLFLSLHHDWELQSAYWLKYIPQDSSYLQSVRFICWGVC